MDKKFIKDLKGAREREILSAIYLGLAYGVVIGVVLATLVALWGLK